MSLSVRLGALLLSLSLTTFFVLLLRADLSPLRVARSLAIWRWSEWSFDADWLSRRQLAAFTLVYASAGLSLVFTIIPVVTLIIIATIGSLLCTLVDRRVAIHVQTVGVPPSETKSLSDWRWFNSQKAHDFTRNIETGEIMWVPSTLTTLSLSMFTLALGLVWVLLAGLYPTSATSFGLVSALTVGIPPLLACMLGPLPRLFK